MNAKITSKMFKDINQKDRSILYRTNNKDNFSNVYFIMTLTLEEMTRLTTEFNRNYGIVNTGERISISSENNISYFKIPTDYRLSSSLWSNKVQNLSSLLQKETRALMVYINGKKIPDNEIKLFISDNGTDIFIPYEFLDFTKPMEVFVEDTMFKNHEYIHFYKSKLSDSEIIINLTGNDDYFDFDTFKTEKLLVYKNGLLDNSNIRAKASNVTKTITITADSEMIGQQIEIFYNHFIQYKFKESYSSPLHVEELYYKFDNNFISTLNGPIPKRSCAFYRNGLRLHNNQIEQISRQIYKTNADPSYNTNNICFYYQDSSLNNNYDITAYCSDYYINGMLGNTRLFKLLTGESTNTVFDQIELDYNKILNKNTSMYNILEAEKYYKESSIIPIEDDFYEMSNKLIKRNPSLIRDFLRKFSRNVNTYIFRGNQQDILLGSKQIPLEGNELVFDIFLNWERLTEQQYSVSVQNNVYTIKIPKELLKDGNNYIEVNETQRKENSNNINYLEYEVGHIGSPDHIDYKGTLVIPRATIDEKISELNHLVIYEYSEGSDDYLYPDSLINKGYTCFKDYEIDITQTNYRFNFKKLPENRFIIYFQDFSYENLIVYDKTGENDFDSKVFIYHGEANNPIPISPIGMPTLYVNNKLFIYGLDYVFSTPIDNDMMAGSVFSFTRKLSKGDIISYKFSGIKNTKVFDTPANLSYISKYGLLYFSSLKFPYHQDYLDLYIDGKKVFKTDIDLLSDKLIRVKNIPTPFRDIYLETKFNINYEYLEELISYYEPDEFEYKIGELFAGVDPIINKRDEQYPHHDDIYMSFEDTVGENIIIPREENPKNTEEAVERQDLMATMYMKWIVSEDARSVFFNDAKMSDKVYGNFKLYQVDANITDINIDGNSASMSSKTDYHFNANPPKDLSYTERIQYIIDFVKQENREDIFYEDFGNLYINSAVSNLILPNDLPGNDERDALGRFKYANSNIEYFAENKEDPVIITPIILNTKLKLSVYETDLFITKKLFLFCDTDADRIEIQNSDETNLQITEMNSIKLGRYYIITTSIPNNYTITFTAFKAGCNSITKTLKINAIRITTPSVSLQENTNVVLEQEFEFNIISDLDKYEISSDNDNIIVTETEIPKRFRVIAKKIGSSKIITKLFYYKDLFIKKEFNIKIQDQNETLLIADINNIVIPANNVTSQIINITTDANDFEYSINKENCLRIEKENNKLTVYGLETGSCTIEIYAQKELHKKVSIRIPVTLLQPENIEDSSEEIEIIDKDIVGLTVETVEITSFGPKETKFDIFTQSTDIKLEIDNPEFATASIENNKTITVNTLSIIPGESTLTIIASREGFRDNKHIVKIKVIE